MNEFNTTWKVSKGDCAWNFARNQLKRENKSVNNADIVKEMNRLAKLNDCANVEDFNKKFFSSIGKEIKLAEQKTPQINSKPAQKTVQNPVQKPAHKPVQTQAQKPVQAQAQRPVQAQAQKPVQAQAQKPVQTQAQRPVQAQAQRPVQAQAQKPVQAQAQKPVQRPESPASTRVVAPKDSTRVVAPSDSTKVAKKDSTALKRPAQLVLGDATENKYNKIEGDAQRIIAYNKDHYQGQYYGIVDKKSAQLKIYDKQGNVVKSFTVGIGKTKGDNVGSYYMDHAEKTKDAYKAESNRYTTAGEFTLDDHKTAAAAYTGKDGKPKIMGLKGDNRGVRSGQMSIHMLYKPQYKQREAAINSKGLEDNRMSYGCVNLKEEDYDLMHAYLGEGDKVFVLPEEKGNRLNLTKQKDGSYKFEQAYHKNDKRGYSKEVASRVNYDVRKDRDPKVIAAKKAAHEKQLAQQKQKTEIKWYNPTTWFS